MDTLITIYGENGEPMSVETTAAFESLSQHEKAEALRTMAHYLRDLALIEAVGCVARLDEAQWDDLLEAGETTPPREPGSHLRLVHSR